MNEVSRARVRLFVVILLVILAVHVVVIAMIRADSEEPFKRGGMSYSFA